MRKVLHNFRWWENHEPQTMRVEGDQVVARDSRTDLNWEGADRMDCLGKVLRPGFIDCHCHILPMGLDIQKLNLEGIEDRGELLDRIRDRHRSQPDGWLHAVHYDQNRLAGGHLTRAELDAISVDRPILIRHVNGHASVANSQALASAGVDETVIDPKGGEFVRDAEGRLTGVLLETAHERVTNQMPLPTLEEMTEAILAAGHRMREWGITAASDMMTGRFDLKLELEAYRAARRRGMPIRVRLYVQWSSVFGKRAGNFEDTVSWFTSDDQDWVRVAGIKLFADGAIGSATAAVYEPYTGGGKGHLIYSPEELSRRVLIAHNSGFAVATHTIGDRAPDVILDALEATGEPSRHRIEHAMIRLPKATRSRPSGQAETDSLRAGRRNSPRLQFRPADRQRKPRRRNAVRRKPASRLRPKRGVHDRRSLSRLHRNGRLDQPRRRHHGPIEAGIFSRL